MIPALYYYSNTLSFLEPISPEYALLLCGLNKITTVQLNTQYRMVPDISTLANAISRRNVQTRIVHGSCVHLTYPSTTGPASPILYTGLITD